MTQTTTTTPAPSKTAAKRDVNAPAKTFGKMLSDGKNEQMRFLAVARGDGTAISYATHIVRDPESKKVLKSTRGATQEHANLEVAKRAVLAGIEKAKAKGWVAGRAGGGGFRAQPDAFDLNSLPSPGKSKK